MVVAMETPKALVGENNLLLMCLLRAAIVPLFLTSVCLRLPFQNLVASQCIEALIVLPWIACLTKEDSSAGLAAAVDKVGCLSNAYGLNALGGFWGTHSHTT